MSSIAIITLIPALMVFGVVQRHIVAGLTFGALKASPMADTTKRKPGFLPIVSNGFDRLFIGICLFVALELLRLAVIGQFIPLIFCHILALGLGVWILWRGLPIQRTELRRMT